MLKRDEVRVHSSRCGHFGIYVTVTDRVTKEFATVYGKRPLTHNETIEIALVKLNKKIENERKKEKQTIREKNSNTFPYTN